MSTSPPVSVVVPCFNEGARIASTARELDEWFSGMAEILIVDDGSSDDTALHAAAVASSVAGVRLHRLPSNRGKGGAIRAAIPLVRGERVLLVDADLAFDRASVERVLAALDDVDVALGNRRHDRSNYVVPVRLFGFLYRRHVVGLAFSLLVRGLLRVRSRDTQCGLKAFRREALQRIGASLTTDGFAADVEMLLVTEGLRLRTRDVPVQVTYRSGRSSVRLLRSAATMGTALLRMTGRRLSGRYSPARVQAAARELLQPRSPRPTTPPR